jgi:hypothetical protein
MKAELVARIDKDYGVFDGTTFKSGRFARYLVDNGIRWPRTPSGRLATDEDTFSDMSKRYPQLVPLKELRRSLAELRLEKIAVGPDDRNRTLLSPFGAKTGRNTPAASRFVFGPSKWLRGALIRPERGRSIAYADWHCQEVWIAAALSGDLALLAAVQSGDPYLAFAKTAGLAPADATKESHGHVRDMCKVAVLGTNYGMQARSLAARTGLSEIAARDLLRRLAQMYPQYTPWAERVADSAQLAGYLNTVFGWILLTNNGSSRPTAYRNFPMQANGAEMLRLACIFATERGVTVCAPVHDALLIEADTADIGAAVAITQEAMAEASRIVLAGLEIPTDVKIFDWPDRFPIPDNSRVMLQTVTEILAELS